MQPQLVSVSEQQIRHGKGGEWTTLPTNENCGEGAHAQTNVVEDTTTSKLHQSFGVNRHKVGVLAKVSGA